MQKPGTISIDPSDTGMVGRGPDSRDGGLPGSVDDAGVCTSFSVFAGLASDAAPDADWPAESRDMIPSTFCSSAPTRLLGP